jgi:serine/threonine protein kinase/formylglycine-generating enzyme required for sulfatase activity
VPASDFPGAADSSLPGPSADSIRRELRGFLPSLMNSSSRAFFRREHRERPQPAPGLEAGKLVGEFRLVHLIGQGGMGQVWEAEQTSLERRVAVKFVRPERLTQRYLELFAREARAGGRLHHPGIVTVHSFGRSDGLAWIAMELVEDAWTLQDFLDEAARAVEVPEGYDRDVARFVAEIADAMAAAHEAGVIHRDLKPQNVLITRDDRPKVTDFGLARLTDEAALSHTGEFVGTYFYMSPEQVGVPNGGVDHRTDIFSLGVVLYELLALRRPFEGDTWHQVAAQIAHRDPPDLRSIRSRVPRDLAVIASKALEKERDRRFQSMADFAADLRRHLGNEPIRARPPTPLERAVKWSKRNPAKSAAAAIASVAFTAIALLLAANLRANRNLKEERSNLAAANVALEAKSTEALDNARRALTGEQQARDEKDRADREAAEAIAARDEVLRLSALQRLEDLAVEADRLWPAQPELIDEYEGWIARAQGLVDELPEHERKLAELRAKARPGPSGDPAQESDGKRSTDPQWNFDDDQDKWWHNQLVKLTSGIRALADERTGLLSEGTSAEHGWGIPKRLSNALALREGFAPGGQHALHWDDVLPELRAAYPDLALTPQIGLVPIGPDPQSSLWEFAHLQTGEPALRGADGRLAIEEETGLVLVLLPGGTFQMGAQKKDASAPNYDPRAADDEGPVRAVTLSAFFLSKYEMTQAQWERVTGANPSLYKPGNLVQTLLHPVERVSWFDCTTVAGRLGLELPSEAQLEYAGRARTSSVWWTGNERDSLMGTVNLADQSAARAGASWPGIKEWPELDDGYAVHAPVDAFVPNAFGLFNVHGNVVEWCRDGYDPDFYGKAPSVDPVCPTPGASTGVARGGSFDRDAAFARSAIRFTTSHSSSGGTLGLRPARAITP